MFSGNKITRLHPLGKSPEPVSDILDKWDDVHSLPENDFLLFIARVFCGTQQKRSVQR